MDLPWINNQQFCKSNPDLYFVDPGKGGGVRQLTWIHPRLTINNFVNPPQIKIIYPGGGG